MNNDIIERPIFIVGSGRSGTTVFYNFFSIHPDVCWFSNYSDRYYNLSFMPFFHRIIDLPLIGKQAKEGIISKKRFWIKPSEAGKIYHKLCGFEYSSKTTETDLDENAEKRFKDQIGNHLKFTGKKRFLNKQTANTQRIKLIHEMFKDAIFIHVIRDGRAVANSLLNVSWRDEMDIWWINKDNPSEKNELINREAIELCGLHWSHNVKEIQNNKSIFGQRYMEILYEDFIKDVRGTLIKVMNFCDLSFSESFLQVLPHDLPNMNNKWQDELSDHQINLLNKAIQPTLIELGYN